MFWEEDGAEVAEKGEGFAGSARCREEQVGHSRGEREEDI